jgi:hypothetical protein
MESMPALLALGDAKRLSVRPDAVAAEANVDLGAIEAHVQARLLGRVRDFRLAATENGLVLRGQAHSYYAKQLAQHAVMQVTGVRIAANEIVVS